MTIPPVDDLFVATRSESPLLEIVTTMVRAPAELIPICDESFDEVEGGLGSALRQVDFELELLLEARRNCEPWQWGDASWLFIDLAYLRQ